MKTWEPTPKQREFLDLPEEIDEGFFGGAAGPGKTEALLADPIYHGYVRDPHFTGIIFRKSYPDIAKSLLPRSAEMYRAFGGSYNGEDHVWSFQGGGRVFFGYMRDMMDARKHDTNQYNYIGWEELTHFPKDVYIYMLQRNRRLNKEDKLPAYMRGASNPGNIGHLWVRQRFIESARAGGVVLRDPETDTKRIFIKAVLQDNPHLDPGYIRKLMLQPAAERRAKMLGDWWAYTGQVFSEWRDQHLLGEPSNAIHVIKPFKIPLSWPKLLGIDWGYRAWLWAGWGAISPEGRMYVYREYCTRRTKIAQWASDIAKLTKLDGNLKACVLDRSAWKDEGHEKTIAEQFADYSGINPERSFSSRIAGKMIIHDMLRWKARPPRWSSIPGYNQEEANRIFRNQGIDALSEYVDSFMGENVAENLPLVQVFDTCQKLIETIPACVYAEDRKGKKAEDIAEFHGDDPIDGFRYLCALFADRRPIHTGANIDDMKSRILREFERTKDWNVLYMYMPLVEHQRSHGVHLRRSSL